MKQIVSLNCRLELKVDGVLDSVSGIVRPVKERKKHDRFNGMSEEEVSRRTLPDHLAENLDIIIVSTIDVLSYTGHCVGFSHSTARPYREEPRHYHCEYDPCALLHWSVCSPLA